MARRWHEQSGERLAFLLALGLHFAAALALRQGSHALGGTSDARTARERMTVPHEEVEIDLDDPSWSDAPIGTPAAPPAVTPERAGSAAIAPTGPSYAARSPVLADPHEPASETATAVESEPVVAEAAVNSPARAAPIDLGLGADGWRRWAGVLPRTSPRLETERRRRPVFRAPPASSTGGLQEGLEAHDRALGLGPAGRVVTALYQAAHREDAPELGTARFNVTVLRTGAVEVTLSETSDKKWQPVAVHAATALLSSPPRIPPPRDGYRFTVKIAAEAVNANGVKREDLHGPRVEAVAPRFRDVKEEQKEIALKNPTAGVGPAEQDVTGQPIIFDPPGVFLAGKGKICSYRVGITPGGLHLGGGCDPTGAKFQRLVRTAVEEQLAF